MIPRLRFYLVASFIIGLLVFAAALLPAQQPPFKVDDVIQIDPKITVGKFENGLTYYIRQNKKPEKRAEFRLVVKAGSVLEDDDQQGLAHFVEHMAFNGTKSFPKQELISFLERIGMRLGPDVNAYTSFDETVYMLQVPTDSANLIQKAFQILSEWASAVTLDPTEIDKERGVVIEEWRLGKGAFERVRNKHFPIMFYNSQYAKRLPIGKKEVLDTASYETVTRFYRDWYRPNLMAVVAVGDFEKPEIEALIKQHFQGLKNPPSPRKRTEYTLPDHQAMLASVATDKELPFTQLQILFKRNLEEEKTVGDYRRISLLSALYDGMVNARLQERLQKPNPPFSFAFSGNARFVGKKQAYQMFASVSENAIAQGIDELVSEAFRVKQHGFTESELERQKAERLRYFQRQYEERDKSESRILAAEFIRNFLQDEIIPGIAVEYEINKQFIPGVTLEEVNMLAALRLTDGNRIITLSAPQKEGVKVPTEDQLLAEFEAASEKQTTAYVDVVKKQPLIALLPKPGRIVNETKIESLGVTEWRLSNGARVVLKPTDFKNEEILFSAYSEGGTSLSSDADFTSSRFAATAANTGGVGEFDAITLQKMLAGKIVNVSPTVSELSEGFSGNATPQDLETLFQLVYLYFTAPREDSSAFNAFLSRQKTFLLSRSASPEATFFDTVQVTMAQYHYRARPLTPALFDEVKLNKAFAFYKDRFADASDFTFFFVGSFKLDGIKTFVEQYLAGLPSLKRKESWRDIKMVPPRGVIEKEVRKGIEPKSMVQMFFTGAFEWNNQNRYDLASMIEYMRIKMREVLREDKGGVYGVQVSGTPSYYPRQEYTITVGFGCAPERVEELVDAVMQQVDSAMLKPIDNSYVEKIQEIQRREREVNLKENRFWLSQFRAYYANKEDPGHLLEFDKLVKGLNGSVIQVAAKKYFNKENLVRLVLYPEKK